MNAIDLFAGGGGFTLGAEQAGAHVVWAANHSQVAVATHALNHPGSEVVCQDLRQANFHEAPDHDLMLAAPACQGHSQAAQPARAVSNGVRGTHDKLRATAWAIVDCAEAKRPSFLLVENVLDFRRWKLYGIWKKALALLGYALEEHVLTASKMGLVPQRRKRLFIAGSLSKNPLGLSFDQGQPEPACGSFVDYSDPGPRGWSMVADASTNTYWRIQAAQERHGDRCLTQHVTGHTGVPLDEPIRTITTGDQWAVVDGPRYRPLTIRENLLGMGFPAEYQFPAGAGRRTCITMIGNAVCPPVGRALVKAIATA